MADAPLLDTLIERLADGDLATAAAGIRSAPFARSPARHDVKGLIEYLAGRPKTGEALVNRACQLHRALATRTWPPFVAPAHPVAASGRATTGHLLHDRRPLAVDRLIAICRRAEAATVDGPRRSRLVARRGQLLELGGRSKAALDAYDEARRLAPGWGGADTDRALLLLRRAGHRAAPPRPHDPGAGGVVSKLDLGGLGRFGNQILQYMFLRAYARRLGLEAEAPDWIGRYLYRLDDPYVGAERRGVTDTGRELYDSFAGRTAPLGEVDARGYFMMPTGMLSAERDVLLDLFALQPPFATLLEDAMARLRAGADTVVALHLRRGDVADRHRDLAERHAAWLKQRWGDWRRPVLFLATDDPANMVPHFAAFAPVTATDLAAPFAGVEFFLDHAVATRADIVIASPGTFSFTAALLNRQARLCVRLDGARDAILPFDPWDALPGPGVEHLINAGWLDA